MNNEINQLKRWINKYNPKPFKAISFTIKNDCLGCFTNEYNYYLKPLIGINSNTAIIDNFKLSAN